MVEPGTTLQMPPGWKVYSLLAPLVYLASPYTHADPAVMEARFQAATRYAARLMGQGVNVFSPIAYTHVILQHGLPVDWDFWKQYGEKWLAVCDSMIVLMLDGWEASKGVNAEIAIMGAAGKSIEWHAPAGRVHLRDLRGG